LYPCCGTEKWIGGSGSDFDIKIQIQSVHLFLSLCSDTQCVYVLDHLGANAAVWCSTVAGNSFCNAETLV